MKNDEGHHDNPRNATKNFGEPFHQKVCPATEITGNRAPNQAKTNIDDSRQNAKGKRRPQTCEENLEIIVAIRVGPKDIFRSLGIAKKLVVINIAGQRNGSFSVKRNLGLRRNFFNRAGVTEILKSDRSSGSIRVKIITHPAFIDIGLRFALTDGNAFEIAKDRIVFIITEGTQQDASPAHIVVSGSINNPTIIVELGGRIVANGRGVAIGKAQFWKSRMSAACFVFDAQGFDVKIGERRGSNAQDPNSPFRIEVSRAAACGIG